MLRVVGETEGGGLRVLGSRVFGEVGFRVSSLGSRVLGEVWFRV